MLFILKRYTNKLKIGQVDYYSCILDRNCPKTCYVLTKDWQTYELYGCTDFNHEHAEMLYKTKRKIWAIKQNRLESSKYEIKTENTNDDVEIIAN